MFREIRLYYFFLLAIILHACGDADSPKYNVFRYNQINHITSLDPAFAKSQNNIWTTHHIFDGLVQLDDSLHVTPAIAHSWTISGDGLVYTFHLRTDVMFHDHSCLDHKSRRVTADDVVYSLARLIDPDVNSPGSWLFADKISGPSAFAAVDDSTMTITIDRPFIPMLGILTMQYCSVVPRECVASEDINFGTHPIGTGPFKFKRWEENQALFLTKYDHYFEPTTHNLDGIKTTFIPDKKIAFLELLNGKLDFVSGLESSFVHDLLTQDGALLPKREEQLDLHKAPCLNTEYLGINMESQAADSPLRDRKIRQALNLGIDRQLMLSALRNGVGRPANAGFVPSGLPSHDATKVSGYTYDPDSARTLIAEAGYGLDRPVPTIELFTNKDYLDLVTFAARQWQEVGINTRIEVLESSIVRDGMRKGSIPFFRASWIADYPDAESFLCMFYSKYPAPPNYTRYSDPVFDALYERAIITTDAAQRYAIYQQMDRMLIEDAPVIFLFYDETALFSRDGIEGISENALNLLEVENIRK